MVSFELLLARVTGLYFVGFIVLSNTLTHPEIRRISESREADSLRRDGILGKEKATEIGWLFQTVSQFHYREAAGYKVFRPVGSKDQ